MATRSIRHVGIVVDSTQMYGRRVARGIAAVGAEAGWDWLLASPQGASALTVQSAGSLDGIIGQFEDLPGLDQITAPALPKVDISGALSISKNVQVTTDNIAVGRVAAAYLLSLGLAHYAYFGWRDRAGSQLRRQGFTSAIKAAGFECESFPAPSGDDEMVRADDPNHPLIRWLVGLPKPAGIFASDDRRGLQLLAVCRRLNIAVPEQVAVLGVDNDELFCELANPPLSSVALSTQRIGNEAARILEGLMRGRSPDEITLLIAPVGVVPRQSTRLEVIVDPEVAAAVRYIALHVRDDLQVADVLREVLVSRRSLDQRFLKVLGRTPAQEICRAQVELAKQVLSETDESMARVAAMAGFSNAKQLGATFHDATGTSPTAYRRNHRV